MESAHDPMADSLMADYTNVNSNPMLLSAEDVDLWLSTFSILHDKGEEESQPQPSASGVELPDTSFQLLPISNGSTIGPIEYDYSQVDPGFLNENFNLTTDDTPFATANDNDLASLLQRFPLEPQEEYLPQLPETEASPDIEETVPSRPTSTYIADIPEKSLMVQRYVNASSEDESEAPFSAIKSYLEKQNPLDPEGFSPMSAETGSMCQYKSDYSAPDWTDSCSTYSNYSNVSFENRDQCLKQLGRLHIDTPNPNRWIPFEYPHANQSNQSLRSSSSIASDVASVRSHSTSTSSRAPSRRKRSMTNNHKPNRKTTKTDNLFWCTFCGTSFSTKSTWKRHEESIHLMLRTWTCSPHGVMVPLEDPPEILAGAGLKWKTCWFCNVDRENTSIPIAIDGNHDFGVINGLPKQYTVMASHTLAVHCFSHANATTCHDNSTAEKTFIRFDHFARHMRDAHNVEGVRMKTDMKGRPTENPSHGVYQSIPGPAHSRCGFCGEKFNDWNERVHHVAHEFWWKKRRIEEWKGDWGFSKEWTGRLQDARLPSDFTGSPDSQCASPRSASTDEKLAHAGNPIGTPALAPVKTTCAALTIPEFALERDLMASRHTPRFPCDVPGCPKAFCLRKDLHRHKQTIHAEEKPEFHCPVPTCKRFINGFSRKDNLRYHIMKLHIDPSMPCYAAMQKQLKDL